MLILLPPSEGKSPPDSGPRLDLAAQSFPQLNGVRRRVVAELVRLCRDHPVSASAVLGLGPTQAEAIATNARLRRTPCGPAISVYAGVLYEALDYATLSPGAHRRADESVVISSALWGLLRPTDLIPPYRLSGGASIPAIGTMASVWRQKVGSVLDRTDGLIVDLRSSTYASLGPLSPPAARHAVVVRVLVDRGGRRTVVSHSNKATKGRLVRALLSDRHVPADPDDLLAQLDRLGFRAEFAPAVKPGAPRFIDVTADAV